MASHGVPRGVAPEKRDVEKEKRDIEEYRALVDLATTKIAECSYTSEVLHLTSKLLKKNPEYYTVWNWRRLILEHQFSHPPTAEQPSSEHVSSGTSAEQPQAQRTHDIITSDLDFLVPLLIKYPKCYWIWNYRSWLLLAAHTHLLHEPTLSLWHAELALVTKMLTRDSRNFHGWSYRRHIISQIESLSGTSKVEAEFEYTTQMLRKGLQNFSALHYRSLLLPKLLDERSARDQARRKALDGEFDLVERALIDPYNQSPWFYHNYLISTLGRSTVVKDLQNEERIEIHTREMDRIRDMLEDFDDCKWIFQVLLLYAVELAGLKGGLEPSEKAECQGWLEGLRKLDPIRNVRWDDLEAKLNACSTI